MRVRASSAPSGATHDRGVVAEAVVVGALVQRRVHVRHRSRPRAARRTRGSARRAAPPVRRRPRPGPSGVIAKYGGERQLLQADELRALARGDAHASRERRLRARRVRVPALLHEPDAHRLARLGASTRGGRVEHVERGAQDHRAGHRLGDAVHAAAAVREHAHPGPRRPRGPDTRAAMSRSSASPSWARPVVGTTTTPFAT